MFPTPFSWPARLKGSGIKFYRDLVFFCFFCLRYPLKIHTRLNGFTMYFEWDHTHLFFVAAVRCATAENDIYKEKILKFKFQANVIDCWLI